VTERGRYGTHPPFSKEEVALIRKAVRTPGAAVECPRCGSPLSIEGPFDSVATGAAVCWVRCPTCQRILIVRNLTVPPPAG
jgi:hypothetical protein